MRDMLERLQTIREEADESCNQDWDGDEKVELSQEAVVFDESSTTEQILKEAQSIRRELSLIGLEVEHLSRHNERYGTSVRRLTFIKRDSDCMATRIRRRCQAVHARLQALGERGDQLEAQDGPHAAVARIARAQHATLTHDFHAVMADYGRAEEQQKEVCRERLQRQASIMGARISDEHLDELVEKGGEGWGELSQSLQLKGGRSAGWALCEIRRRHTQLVELEARLKQVHELFLHMAVLVEEQGAMVNSIQAHVCSTQDYTQEGNVRLTKALQHKKKNPCLQCCPWMSCWGQGL